MPPDEERPRSSVGVLTVLVSQHMREGRRVRQHERIRRMRRRSANDRARSRPKATAFEFEVSP